MAERVWPGEVDDRAARRRDHEPQLQGSDVGGEAFVLRIAGKDTELLGIDRAVEHEAAGRGRARARPRGRRVRRAGGLPRHAIHRGGGRAVEVDWVGAALRRLHDGRRCPGASTGSASSRPTAPPPHAHGGRHPGRVRAAKEIADQIERRARGAPAPALPQRPAQRELHRRRRRASGSSTGSTRAWATCSSTSANFSVNHEFDAEGRARLLAAYSASGDRTSRALALMRFMSDFREAMWGVVQQAISELDFDFVAYAAEHSSGSSAPPPSRASSMRFGRSRRRHSGCGGEPERRWY